MKPLMVALAGLVGLGVWPGTQMDTTSRERARVMLRHAYELVRKHYYDEKFHGLDLDTRYRTFDEQVKVAPSLNAGMAIVADFLDGLHDSHTYFVPPTRPYDFDYGYRSQAHGNRVFVTQIRPGSDAAAKLRIGDEILVLNGVSLDRDTVSRMRYVLNVLSPQPSLTLTVADPLGGRRDITLNTRSRQGKRRLDLTTIESEDLWRIVRQSQNDAEDSGQRYYETGKVMIWKMPDFAMQDADVDAIFDIVRKHEALVLDLRGNPGGFVDTLLRMVGAVFPKDVQVGTLIARTPRKPLVAKSRGTRAYLGEITVLVDAESASAAELFARVIQLEGRGTVVGDRSSGSVMQSRGHGESQGLDTVISYYFSVTDADVVMRDGKSLEHAGVTPTLLVIPTAEDLAAGRDVAMVRALELAGLGIDPVKAGELFPFKWKPF